MTAPLAARPAAWERVRQRLALARRRRPLAVLPGHLISPMDAQRTVTIAREVVLGCEPVPR